MGPALTWSVKGIVCIENCGKEAKGECADAERHVKARVSEVLEPLCTDRRLRSIKDSSVIMSNITKVGFPDPASALGLCSLSLGPRWSFQPEWRSATSAGATFNVGLCARPTCSMLPGVLLTGAPPAVQRDDFFSADACFTHRTLLPAGWCLQPLGIVSEWFHASWSPNVHFYIYR